VSSINVDSDDKAWFDEFKQSDENQAEAFARLVENAKAYNGELIDSEEVAEETAEKMGPKLELVLYRLLDELKEGD